LHLGDDGFGQHLGDAASALVMADSDNHQIAPLGERPSLLVLAAFMNSHSDDLSVDLGDDHSSIEIGPLLVSTPRDQAGHDLGHFIEPDRVWFAEVKIDQRRFVVATCVTQNH